VSEGPQKCLRCGREATRYAACCDACMEFAIELERKKNLMTPATTTSAHVHVHLHSYADALVVVRDVFAGMTKNTPLFTTDASNLWQLFLDSLPADRRQHYTCRSCQHFINRYGGLAVIDERDSYRLHSPLWPIGKVSDQFMGQQWEHSYEDGLGTAFAALGKAVARAKITGVFLAETPVLGVPQTGEWSHFHAQVSARHINRSTTATAGQAMAEKRQEYAMLSRSFGDFSIATVRTTNELLHSGQLYRSEKCQGVAQWLVDLYTKRESAPNKDHVTWLAVADALPGYCHVRSGMIGTLLEDVQAGLPFDQIKKRFDEKMHPLQYLRPTAEPSVGNVMQAERVIAAMKTSGSLARRFARLDEVDALWKPKEAETAKPDAKAPVFGHLLKRQRTVAPSQSLPPVAITWVKFRDVVLPGAASVEFMVSHVQHNYCAIVTAVDADAPPLLQWDREDRRNPASWYLYDGGSLPAKWNLVSGWTKVNAFALRPCHWYSNESAKEGNGVIAILDGARDTTYQRSGGFFPENLRSEYHAVRKTLEAYAKQAVIADKENATACGVLLSGGAQRPVVSFRVTTLTGMTAIYNIDRWD
jgi:hypothetical protein